jgi:hypothetical protein
MPPVDHLLAGWRPQRRSFLATLGPPVVAIALLADTSSPCQQTAYRPALVEAELVERFTQFIDWPPDRLAEKDGPFVLGLLGRNEVEPAIEKLARERFFKKHRVEVRRLEGPEGAEACHAVWIGGSADAQLAAVLARTTGKPILTLGDTEGFAQRGVMINLRRESSHIAFEINLDEARKSGLKFSSRLLALGKIVAAQGQP